MPHEDRRPEDRRPEDGAPHEESGGSDPAAGAERAAGIDPAADVDPAVIGELDFLLHPAKRFIASQQAGIGGRVTPDAASALPAGVVRELGLWTHRGPLLDLAVLSALTFRYRLSLMDDVTWMRAVLKEEWVREDPELPDLLDLRPGMVWVSRQRVAKDLRARWRFADPDGAVFGRAASPHHRPWTRFFENVRNAFARLEEAGHVRRLHDVQLHGKRKGSMGSVFTLDGTPVGDRLSDRVGDHAGALYDLAAPRALLLHPGGPDAALEALLAETGDDGGGEPVPAVDLVGAAVVAFAAHRDHGGASSPSALREASPLVAVGPYDRSEVRRALAGGSREAQFRRWTNRQAKHGPGDDQGPYAERHVSVGAWRKGRAIQGRDEEPCTAPWLVLDFDRGGDVEEACESAQRAVVELLRLGVRPGDLVCAYTGGRGFHVHLPTGAFGSPLFRDAGAAKAVLRTLTLALVDEHVDGAVLSPLHLARAVGSGYHAPAEGTTEAAAAVLPPAGFKQRIPTERFVSMTVAEAVAAGGTYEPSTLPDPRGARPVGALVLEAVVATRPEPAYAVTGAVAGRRGKTDAVRAVEGGVGRGERNAAAFVMATYLLDNEGMDVYEAHAALEAWNLKNRPPLGPSELARVLTNAEERVFG